MDAQARQADTAKILGSIALATGLAIAAIGLATDSTPAKGFFFAALLVATGIGLRLEAALTMRRG